MSLLRKAAAIIILLALVELAASMQQENPLEASKVDYEVKTKKVRSGGQLIVVFTVENSGALEHRYVLKCGSQIERFELKGGEQRRIEFKLEATGEDYSWEIWADDYLLAMGTIAGYEIVSTPAPSPLAFLLMVSAIAALLSASVILALLKGRLEEGMWQKT